MRLVTLNPLPGRLACSFLSLRVRLFSPTVNVELMATYRAVRRSPDEVAAQLKGLRRSKREYLRMRSIRPSRLTPTERAARFIYLNGFA